MDDSTGVGFGRRGLSKSPFLWVARLQNEVGTKEYFCSRHEFSHRKCSEIFPEILEPLFCVSEKDPANFPPDFPAKNQKISPTNFCRSAGRTFLEILENLKTPQSVENKGDSEHLPESRHSSAAF